MKKLLVCLFVLTTVLSVHAQTPPHWLQIKGTPIIDIRQFGAKNDGTTDNAAALASASAFIQARGGECSILFPAGTYKIIPGGEATGSGTRDLWKAFSLTSCENVGIYGEPGAKIISAIDMGNAGVDGKSMDIFYFKNCTNVTIRGLDIDVTVSATRSSGLDAYPELLFPINFLAEAGTASGLVVKECKIRVNNATNGNGAKYGYEFASILAAGAFPTATATNILVSDCEFTDGQGPVVWFQHGAETVIDNCRFIDCGGPLNSVRSTFGWFKQRVSNCYFQMKHQPGEDSIGHNFPIAVQGKTFSAAEPPSQDLIISDNIFRTLDGTAIAVNGGENISISGNIIHSEIGDVATATLPAIALGKTNYENCESISITGNSFENILAYAAISTFNTGTKYLSIVGNTFDGCKYAYTNAAGWPSGVIFSGNTVANGTDYQIYLSGVATSTSIMSITGNTFTNNLRHCILLTPPDSNFLNISGNSFYTNGINASGAAEATILTVGGNITITGNLLCDSKGVGIYVANSANSAVLVTNNNITGSGRTGIYFSGSNAILSGNVLHNGNQQKIASESSILINTGSLYTSVSNNRIIDQGGYNLYGINMASASFSLAHGNLLYGSCVATGTPLATGTAGVADYDNKY